MRVPILLALLTGASAACTAPGVRPPSAEAANEAEIAAFLAADPRAAQIVRDVAPPCRDDTDECRMRTMGVAAARAQQGRSWATLAPTGDGQAYAIEHRVLQQSFPLRFGAWVLRSRVSPDPFERHGFALLYWEFDCGAGTYRAETELELSRHGTVSSARHGERRTITPAAGSGEAQFLGRLCNGRTETPPPGYRHFD